MAINVSLDQAQAWEDTENTSVYFAPNRSYVGIDFYVKAPPFDDIHVRRAIAYACDRQAYVDQLLDGHGEAATALTTPEQMEGVYGPEGAREALAVVLDLPYDLEAAKAELAQSKVPDGFTTKVGISNSAPQVSAAFQVLKQAVEPLGIIIEIDEMPVEQWYDTIGSKDWGLAYMDYTSTTGDPAEMSTWFLGPYGPAGYTNDEVTALMDQVMKETDPEEARRHTHRGAARGDGGHSLHSPVVGRSSHGHLRRVRHRGLRLLHVRVTVDAAYPHQRVS